MNINLCDVQFAYPSGVVALQGITLRVAPGERVAIVGQNGSGKTTLARHLNGLLKPTRGTVQIGDWTTADYSVARLARRIGYVFQNPDEQLCKRTVRDEVAFGAINLGFNPDRVARQVDGALVCLELESFAAVNPHDLSSAWRRRVAIASVVAMDTPVIVLDEPTTGQDQRFQAVLADLLTEWQGKGKTVITISHDMDFVAEQFERVIVMGQGQVLLDGLPTTVFKETAMLATTFLQPPQLTRLAIELGLPEPVCTETGFLQAFTGG